MERVSRKPLRVEVEIDEVRLVGVPTREQRRVVAALEREIGEALVRRGESLGAGGDVTLGRIDAGELALGDGAPLRGLGERIVARPFGEGE